MMSIWLPFPNVRQNLLTLNDSHLADVVWQGLDVLRAIPRPADHGPTRHVRMWLESPAALLAYVVAAEAELRARGVGEEPRVQRAFTWYGRIGIPLAPVPPWWYGNPMFHSAQRSHLIAVDPVHYARRVPLTTPLDLKLIWPLETPNEWAYK
jgi:hypothetical protein